MFIRDLLFRFTAELRHERHKMCIRDRYKAELFFKKIKKNLEVPKPILISYFQFRNALFIVLLKCTEYVYNEYRWKGRNYKGQHAPEIVELVRIWLSTPKWLMEEISEAIKSRI